MAVVALTSEEVAGVNRRFEGCHPVEIMQWAAERFYDLPGGLVMTSSFGAESMCTVHMAMRALPGIKIVVVNTGYLFPETLAFMERMRRKFDLNIWEYHGRHDPVTWLTVNGETDPRVRKNVEACCGANKNEVFDRAMRELAPSGWMRGVRANQSETRAGMEVVQWSKRNNCWAISPILRWGAREIHGYMKEHGLEYHPLWEKGYVSIGCNPETCTRAIGVEEDQRAGRWAGTGKKECGLHLE